MVLGITYDHAEELFVTVIAYLFRGGLFAFSLPQRLHKPEECYDYAYGDIHRHFINPSEVIKYYGVPKAQFRCEGIDFLIYDNARYAPYS